MEAEYKCKRCNRGLRSPDSQKLGYGPTCAVKAGIVKPKLNKIIKDESKSLYNETW